MNCAQVVLNHKWLEVQVHAHLPRLPDLCPFYYVHGLLPKDPIFDSHWSWLVYLGPTHVCLFPIFLLSFYSKERICCLFPIFLSIFSPLKQTMKMVETYCFNKIPCPHYILFSFVLHTHFSLSVISHLPGTFCHFRFFLSTFVEYFYDIHVLSFF